MKISSPRTRNTETSQLAWLTTMGEKLSPSHLRKRCTLRCKSSSSLFPSQSAWREMYHNSTVRLLFPFAFPIAAVWFSSFFINSSGEKENNLIHFPCQITCRCVCVCGIATTNFISSTKTTVSFPFALWCIHCGAYNASSAIARRMQFTLIQSRSCELFQRVYKTPWRVFTQTEKCTRTRSVLQATKLKLSDPKWGCTCNCDGTHFGVLYTFTTSVKGCWRNGSK